MARRSRERRPAKCCYHCLRSERRFWGRVRCKLRNAWVEATGYCGLFRWKPELRAFLQLRDFVPPKPVKAAEEVRGD